MDIDQDGELLGQEHETAGQIILPRDAMPGIIHVIGQAARPFFPGQAIPLIMSTEAWLPTLQAVKKRGQANGNWLERELRNDLALGPAEVRRQHDARPLFEGVPDGRERGTNPCVVRNLAVLQRNVEIYPNERGDAFEVQVLDRTNRFGHAISPRSTRSARGRACGSRSPTSCRTSSAPRRDLRRPLGSARHRKSRNVDSPRSPSRRGASLRTGGCP